MAWISKHVSESLEEYLVLTEWMHSKLNVSLESKLGDMIFQYPIFMSRMQSVVGPESAVTAGRLGMLPCVPQLIPDAYKQEIIEANNNSKLKKGQIEYIDKPKMVTIEDNVGEAIELARRTGHSVIPVIDDFRKLHGVYVHDPEVMVRDSDPVTQHMQPLKSKKEPLGIPYLISRQEARVKKALQKSSSRFIPIIDKRHILQKLAFMQKFDTNYLAITISSGPKWKDDLDRWGPYADTLMLDSSNVCYDDALKIMKAAKKKYDVPFGVGNIIRAKHFRKFAHAGADYLICGMGVGSICKTGAQRANGRGQFTVGKVMANARDKFYRKHGRYVPIVLDGSITNSTMQVALALADFVMGAGYFNQFIESPGWKLDKDENMIPDWEKRERDVKYVESWGEGSEKAHMVGMYGIDYRERLARLEGRDVSEFGIRYGQKSKGATIEGVAGIKPSRGRMKPNVESDARLLRATMANSYASNLEEYRDVALLERMSEATHRKMQPHNLLVKEE